jgi:hypothetical protein
MKLTKSQLQQIIKEEMKISDNSWNSAQDAEDKEKLPENWAKVKAAIEVLSGTIEGGYLNGKPDGVEAAAEDAMRALKSLSLDNQYMAAHHLLMHLRALASQQNQNITSPRDLGS